MNLSLPASVVFSNIYQMFMLFWRNRIRNKCQKAVNKHKLADLFIYRKVLDTKSPYFFRTEDYLVAEVNLSHRYSSNLQANLQAVTAKI